MNYESSYSKNQFHFFSTQPDWAPHLQKIDQFKSILDLGSGGGQNSFHLKQMSPEAVVIPLDLSLIRCAACKQVTDTPVTCANSLTLPFSDDTFDLVISTQVIEHVPDDRVFVQEVNRVLKPNGVALVSSVIKLDYGWYFYRNSYREWVLDPTHVREYRSEQEYAELFSGTLSNTELITENFSFSLARYFYRLSIKFGLVTQPNPNFFIESKIGVLLAKYQINIPRYRRVTIIGTKSA